MTTMGERILQAREKAGLGPAEAARKIGITQSALAQWETDETKPTLPNLIKFVERVGGSLDFILRAVEDGDDAPTFDPREHAPLLSRVEAGRWGNVVTPFSLPQNHRFVELHKKPLGTAIALEVDGFSMLPDYEPEDIIVIDTGLSPQPGDLVVAVVEGDEEATFKRYRPRGNDDDDQPVIELTPINPDFPTLVINAKKPGRIIGTLFQHIRFPRRRFSAA